MKRPATKPLSIFLVSALLCTFFSTGSAATSAKERIVVLPFRSAGVDRVLASEAEELTKEIIEKEDSFQLIRLNGGEETLSEQPSEFLESSELRTMMKELGASMIVEGALEKIETDITTIEIRISARTSAWRPPTVLSTTASSPEFAVSRTEALVRTFINRYTDEQSMERFFQSALVPGLGQYKEGYSSKAGLFFFGTTGFLLGSILLPDGDPYVGYGEVEMRQFPGGVTRWYVGDTVVTPEEAAEEMRRRSEAENSREKATRRKRFLIGAGLAIYAVNLYDILRITKRYDTARGDHFSFKLDPFSPKKMVCLNCAFNW